MICTYDYVCHIEFSIYRSNTLMNRRHIWTVNKSFELSFKGHSSRARIFRHHKRLS